MSYNNTLLGLLGTGAVLLDSRLLGKDKRGDGKNKGVKMSEVGFIQYRINSLQKDLTLNKTKINNKKKCNSSAFALLTPFAREMTSGW